MPCFPTSTRSRHSSRRSFAPNSASVVSRFSLPTLRSVLALPWRRDRRGRRLYREDRHDNAPTPSFSDALSPRSLQFRNSDARFDRVSSTFGQRSLCIRLSCEPIRNPRTNSFSTASYPSVSMPTVTSQSRGSHSLHQQKQQQLMTSQSFSTVESFLSSDRVRGSNQNIPNERAPSSPSSRNPNTVKCRKSYTSLNADGPLVKDVFAVNCIPQTKAEENASVKVVRPLKRHHSEINIRRLNCPPSRSQLFRTRSFPPVHCSWHELNAVPSECVMPTRQLREDSRILNSTSSLSAAHTPIKTYRASCSSQSSSSENESPASPQLVDPFDDNVCYETAKSLTKQRSPIVKKRMWHCAKNHNSLAVEVPEKFKTGGRSMPTTDGLRSSGSSFRAPAVPPPEPLSRSTTDSPKYRNCSNIVQPVSGTISRALSFTDGDCGHQSGKDKHIQKDGNTNSNVLEEAHSCLQDIIHLISPGRLTSQGQSRLVSNSNRGFYLDYMSRACDSGSCKSNTEPITSEPVVKSKNEMQHFPVNFSCQCFRQCRDVVLNDAKALQSIAGLLINTDTKENVCGGAAADVGVSTNETTKHSGEPVLPARPPPSKDIPRPIEMTCN